MPDATVIGAVFTGLAGLLVAWTQLRATRSGTSSAEVRELRTERTRLSKQVDALRRWGIRLEVLLIEKRAELPNRPPQYDPDWGRPEDEEQPKRLRLVGKR